jgi:hypothetical protein
MPKKWIQAAAERMHKKGTEGTLTAAAKKRDMTAMQFARYIRAHPDQFSTLWKKRAAFALNVNK